MQVHSWGQKKQTIPKHIPVDADLFRQAKLDQVRCCCPQQLILFQCKPPPQPKFQLEAQYKPKTRDRSPHGNLRPAPSRTHRIQPRDPVSIRRLFGLELEKCLSYHGTVWVSRFSRRPEIRHSRWELPSRKQRGSSLKREKLF